MLRDVHITHAEPLQSRFVGSLGALDILLRREKFFVW